MDPTNEYHAAILNPDSIRLRESVVEEVRSALRDALASLPESIRRADLADVESATSFATALFLVAQVGEVLLDGIEMLRPNNSYSAAALVRQLVEVEYIAWACAKDPEEAIEWLQASPDERRKKWQPRHIRERSNGLFDWKDYGAHCEAGGHPTPDGIFTYLLDGDRDVAAGVVLYEEALHSIQLCEHILHALPEASAKLLEDRHGAIHDLYERWLRQDPAIGLSKRPRAT